MTAAVIGFIGVVAGALLTAWFSRRAEKAKRRGEACVAATQIARELENVVLEIESAIKAPGWWSGRLSTDKWKAHGAALANEIDEDLFERLTIAYDQIEAWEREKEKPEKPFLAYRGELEKNREQFKELAGRLGGAVKHSIGEKVAKPIAVASGLIGLALVGLLSYAAVVPRIEMTDSSIAAALERELPGERDVVGCSHSADRWNCEAGYLEAPGSGCRAADRSFQPVSLLVQRPAGAGKSCGRRGARPPEDYVVRPGDEYPIANRSAADIARQMRTDKLGQKKSPKRADSRRSKSLERPLELAPSETSYAERAVDWLLGD